MPIYPLPVMLEEEQERKLIEKLKAPETIVVSYGYMKLVGEFPYGGTEIPGCGSKLVVRTDRGVELGKMLTTTCANGGCGSNVSRKQLLEYIEQSGGRQYPFSTVGKVLRLATPEDLAEQARLDENKMRWLLAARALVVEYDLPMKLVEVEPLLSGDKVIFYFLSEDRIDFRELVKAMARDLHCRIELRQVGARDEARLVGDYEKCGQYCCCKQFLKVLKPISMRSAKVQKATLDPSKISGRCGRLMCCLRYEDETYETLRKKLPPRNSRVMTAEGAGTVMNSQILTQLVLVELDKDGQRMAFPNEDIERLKGEAAKRPAPPEPPADGGRPGRGTGPGGRDRGPRGPERPVGRPAPTARPEARGPVDGAGVEDIDQVEDGLMDDAPAGDGPRTDQRPRQGSGGQRPDSNRGGDNRRGGQGGQQGSGRRGGQGGGQGGQGGGQSSRPPVPPRPQPINEPSGDLDGDDLDDMTEGGPDLDGPESLDGSQQSSQPTDGAAQGDRKKRRRRRKRNRNRGGQPGEGNPGNPDSPGNSGPTGSSEGPDHSGPSASSGGSAQGPDNPQV